MPRYTLDHIHLNSTDPEETAIFYENVLGAKKIRTGKMPDGRVTVALDLNGTNILITEQKVTGSSKDDVSARGDIDHFGLWTDNIEQAVAELKQAGTVFTKELGPFRSGKMAFFIAPQNVLVELMGD